MMAGVGWASIEGCVALVTVAVALTVTGAAGEATERFSQKVEDGGAAAVASVGSPLWIAKTVKVTDKAALRRAYSEFDILSAQCRRYGNGCPESFVQMLIDGKHLAAPPKAAAKKDAKLMATAPSGSRKEPTEKQPAVVEEVSPEAHRRILLAAIAEKKAELETIRNDCSAKGRLLMLLADALLQLELNLPVISATLGFLLVACGMIWAVKPQLATPLHSSILDQFAAKCDSMLQDGSVAFFRHVYRRNDRATLRLLQRGKVLYVGGCLAFVIWRLVTFPALEGLASLLTEALRWIVEAVLGISGISVTIAWYAFLLTYALPALTVSVYHFNSAVRVVLDDPLAPDLGTDALMLSTSLKKQIASAPSPSPTPLVKDREVEEGEEE